MNGLPPAVPRGLLLFASIHHVLAAEDVFGRRQIWCDLVPVPRRLSSDCGMAVAFRWSDRAAVREAIASMTVPPVAVFIEHDGPQGYRACELDQD